MKRSQSRSKIVSFKTPGSGPGTEPLFHEQRAIVKGSAEAIDLLIVAVEKLLETLRVYRSQSGDDMPVYFFGSMLGAILPVMSMITNAMSKIGAVESVES